jgi:hypothetical protein
LAQWFKNNFHKKQWFQISGMEAIQGRQIFGVDWWIKSRILLCAWSVKVNPCGAIMCATLSRTQAKHVYSGSYVGGKWVIAST